MNKPDKIIWHHSWLPDDNKILNDFKGICDYHTKVLKWAPPCGYHFVIERVDNKLVCHEGRKLYNPGAHTFGENTTSVGICVIGNFDKIKPDEETYKFCADVVVRKVYSYFGVLKHKRHSDYASKTCPGKYFDIGQILKYIDGKDKKKNWMEILESVKLSDPDWEGTILRIISNAETKEDREKLKYLPNLIEKIYYSK
jgi:N-acetylmuramoyl-L-alanine amidase